MGFVFVATTTMTSLASLSSSSSTQNPLSRRCDSAAEIGKRQNHHREKNSKKPRIGRARRTLFLVALFSMKTPTCRGWSTSENDEETPSGVCIEKGVALWSLCFFLCERTKVSKNLFVFSTIKFLICFLLLFVLNFIQTRPLLNRIIFLNSRKVLLFFFFFFFFFFFWWWWWCACRVKTSSRHHDGRRIFLNRLGSL